MSAHTLHSLNIYNVHKHQSYDILSSSYHVYVHPLSYCLIVYVFIIIKLSNKPLITNNYFLRDVPIWIFKNDFNLTILVRSFFKLHIIICIWIFFPSFRMWIVDIYAGVSRSYIPISTIIVVMMILYMVLYICHNIASIYIIGKYIQSHKVQDQI